MKNIIKLFLASLVIAFVVVSCTDDADRDWTSQEASFKLYNPISGSIVLYETMKSNPFTLSWESVGSGNYSVVLSATEDFATKTELGTSTVNTFTTTIGDFNTKLLKAGFSPFTPQTVYLRVEKGSELSNSINFTVTAYPVAGPIITAPAGGSVILLNSSNQAAVATTVTWSDYANYGVAVNYKVEIAKKGSSTFLSLGEVTIPSPNPNNIAKSLAVSTKDLNTAAINAGGVVGTQADFDLRITAKTSFSTPSIELKSELSGIKLTPYKLEFVNLYLVGDATAAEWNNSATNENMYPLLGDHSVNSAYSYTGYFKAGGFKLIKEKGSWNSQYGAGSAAGTLSTDGGSGNINVATAGYYKFTADVATLTYTLVPVATPGSAFPTVGIIGDATPNSWNSSTAMTKSAFDPHVWYITNVTLTAGELKFRANDSWDVNWGSGDEDFGTATFGGSNIPVKAGTYNIYFNDYSGAYSLIKQ